jgi:HlyD family secretion protein
MLRLDNGVHAARLRLSSCRADAHSFRIIVLIGVLLVAVLLSGCGTQVQADVSTSIKVSASGFIEGDVVTVAAETGGRVAALFVEEGDRVRAGDAVITLDDGALRSRRGEAEAGLAAAQAHLAQVKAGARPEEVAEARADVAAAEAQYEGAAQALIHAREAITNPQSLDAQIKSAQAQVRLAEQHVEMAEANRAEVALKESVYDDRGGDVARVWALQVRAAEAGLDQAEAELVGAQTYLQTLLAMREHPLALEAQRNRAAADAATAEADVVAAQARLDELIAGPTRAALTLAETQVREAEAALALVDARLGQLSLTAPQDGWVSQRAVQVGETATAGMPLLTITNLDGVTLVVYVPVRRIDEIQVGQTVSVTVDTFPDRTFVGHVSSIAGEAAFTPSQVQTEEARVNLVFAVDVTIPNSDQALKLGMPADAVFH